VTSAEKRHPALIVCGNAGVGKSTYALKLAKERRAPLLDIDTVSETLVRAGLSALGHDPNDRDSPRFKSIYRDAIHETLFRIADENLDHLPCIIVAPFTRERRDPGFVSTLRERLKTDVEVIYVWCDEQVRHERIQRRGNPRDTLKLENWESYSQAAKALERPAFPHTFVNTGLEPA
jgi:dephospho-CoA kinase